MKTIMHNLSIDCLVFGFDKELKVLLVKHADGISKDRWALPGGWVFFDESLDAAAARLLSALTGLDDIFLEQLRTFGDVDRFPNQRVVTVSYYSLIRSSEIGLVAGFTASDVKWASLDDIPDLPYDHHDILSCGLKTLRSKVRQKPIGFNLLPKQFSLFELQQLYEAVLNVQFDKPNFRRKILKLGLLKKSKLKQASVSHRAAQLYEFDQEVYQKYSSQKFVLDF